MDELLIEAYTEANGVSSALEEYMCKQLGVYNGYLRDKYYEITKKINKEYTNLTNENFAKLISIEYKNLIHKLSQEVKE